MFCHNLIKILILFSKTVDLSHQFDEKQDSATWSEIGVYKLVKTGPLRFEEGMAPKTHTVTLVYVTMLVCVMVVRLEMSVFAFKLPYK